MKVIKRDGRVVDYDREKIAIAIQKANEEVNLEQRADRDNIKQIMKSVEELDKKRILVEDIQDIVEQKLIELEKYELAKRYVDYSYEKTLAFNNMEESAFDIIRNEDKEFSNSKVMFAENI